MLALQEISKHFPGVRALDRVSLDFRAGEIHGLVGENGAGKSTLIKLIGGVYSPDHGEMRFDNQIVNWPSPGEAKRHGIHVVYQELVLFPSLSVAENIFIGQERRNRLGLIDHGRMRRDARELIGRMGVSLDPNAAAGSLSIADQQMVEIARAMVQRVKLLILDEPTAVIAGREVTLLFERLRALRDAGVSVVFISHRLEEVFAICDRVTVLKDGQLIGTAPVREVTRERLITMMVGRLLGGRFPPKRPRPEGSRPILRTERLAVGHRVHDVSIELHGGEIVGLAGMVGAGRSELALGIFGALPITKGAIHIGGRQFSKMNPALAIELGIGLVTEDRKGQGLAMLLDIAANISAPSLAEITRAGVIDRGQERTLAQALIAQYRVACRGPETPVATMSGGNQQKVLLARWAHRSRNVLILDEPTRGVDVGAKAEIYRIMRDLANAGLAILMISSELTEVVGMADRVSVMREGRITGELAAAELTEERILDLATLQHAA